MTAFSCQIYPKSPILAQGSNKMSFHYHIKPEWDAVANTYKVASATIKGLGEIEAPTRDELNIALLEILPPGSRIKIDYSDYSATLEAPPTP